MVWFQKWLEEMLILHRKSTKPKLKKKKKKKKQQQQQQKKKKKKIKQQKNKCMYLLFKSDIQDQFNLKRSINFKCKTPKL